MVATPTTWAQEFLWAGQLGGGFGDFARGVVVDASGNAYVVGEFAGTADFDPGPGTFKLTTPGLGPSDVFVCKLDSARNFVWAKRMGGTSDDIAYGVALDVVGNVYTVGRFQLTADFDPGPGTFNLTSAGATDVFVSKLDSNGDFLWAKRMGGTSDDSAYRVALDSSGNVHIAGYFIGTADFDPGPGTFDLTSAGTSDVFVAKLGTNGELLWAKRMGGTSDDSAYRVALDANGNVHIAGVFSGTADFDPGPGTFDLTSAGVDDVFVSKLDSNGDFLWAKGMGGTAFDGAGGVALDSSGNVHIAGNFFGTADFDPGPGTFDLTAGATDVFVSKLDSNGDFLWAKQIGGTVPGQSTFPSDVAVDASGNVYSVGTLAGTADFDPGSGSRELTSAGVDDAFLSILDRNGTFLWAGLMGGTSSDQAFGVALDASGNLHVAGSFRGTADFDPGPGTFELTSVGFGDDVFVSKLGVVAAGDVADTLTVKYVAGGDITLLWGDSCVAGDDDYALYEGTIGTWYSHVARFCTTGAATSATFTPTAGNTYFLVVPRSLLREGSYGAASNGTPRPQGAAACAVQEVTLVCP